VSTFTITIRSDGQTMDPAYRVVSLDVGKTLERIPDATVALLDGDPASREFPISDSDFFAPGKPVEIDLRYEGGEDTTVFKGLVVRNMLRVNASQPVLLVELRDAAIALTRQRRSRVFNDLSDSDVFSQLVGDAGLETGQVDSTQPTHAELLQYRVSDWDFLISRAQAFGLCVVVDNGVLSLRTPDLSAAADHRLELGIDELLDIELEADSLDQPAGIEASAWDPANQAATEPVTAAEFELSQGDLTPGSVAEALGYGPDTLMHTVSLDPEELQGWADGSLRRNRLSLLRGRLGLRGRTDLAPFQLLELAGLSNRFNGMGLISGVRQRLDDTGWRTDIELGLDPRRLAQQTDVTELPAGGLLPGVAGLQIGVVDAFEEDPEGEQRLRVLLPVLGEEPGAIWARLAMPHAGAEHGFVFRPEVGDEVVVGFLDEDPRQAVVLGALFSSANTPPGDYAEASEENEHKGIVSRAGTTIGFVDADSPSVFIETPAGNKLLLDDDQEQLTLTDQHGNSLILSADGISVTSAADLIIDASGEVRISGQSIDLS
jgi:Rhs element Vgr protein